MPCGSDRGKVRMLPIEKGRIWMEWKCKKTRKRRGRRRTRERPKRRERKGRRDGTHRLHRRIRVYVCREGW